MSCRFLCAGLIAGLLFGADFTSPSTAQTGRIGGRVVETDRGEGLQGVNVGLEGTSLGSATGEDGTFALNEVPAGEHTVVASFVGYQSEEKTITLDAGRTREVRFTLRLVSFEIEEVVVAVQNRSERLSGVPISATAFTTADLENNRVASVEDYAALTPNLTFAGTGRRSEADVTLRGVSNLGGQNCTYGVYVDGLNMTPSSSDIAINPKLLDVLAGLRLTHDDVGSESDDRSFSFLTPPSLRRGDSWAVQGI